MKIDLKRMHGRQLRADPAEEPKLVSESRRGAERERDYGWLVLVALIATGWGLARVSTTALFIFLGFCAAVLVLMVISAVSSLDTPW